MSDESLKLILSLDDFTRGYIDCMLFSSTDESDESGGEPLDRNYGYSDIAIEAIEEIKADCAKFQEENWDDICAVPDWKGCPDSYGRGEYSGFECAGHDFWFTRNGHGTGFWDRDYDENVRERLDKACDKYGEVWPYVGDDGKIYI